VSELVKVDKPRVVSIEHLARLATEKKAVVFNGECGDTGGRR